MSDKQTFAKPAPTTAPTVDVHKADGSSAGSVQLDPGHFGVTPNPALLHQVVTAQLAAARSGTQSTLTRSEVRGGGTKPWRQKGTGNARAGSIRSPIWRGGGVALGPKPRSYAQKTPKKMVRQALRAALSDRAAEGRIAVVDGWSFDPPRTKDAAAALTALGVTGRVLIVLGRGDEAAYKSFRNLPEAQPILASELNPYDILANEWILFTRETLPGAPESDERPGAGEGPGAPEEAGLGRPAGNERETSS
ncbi:MAG: 50S ribosomal protein L4 [Actinobacteria bacterium]|nr:50S ribosomal protein L4 [Actinomycetota bacterium]